MYRLFVIKTIERYDVINHLLYCVALQLLVQRLSFSKPAMLRMFDHNYSFQM